MEHTSGGARFRDSLRWTDEEKVTARDMKADARFALIALCAWAGAAQSAQNEATPAAFPGEFQQAELTEGLLTDEWFATQAALAGQAEIELSQLAMRKTHDMKVRSFAEKMVRDHQRESELLESVAQEHGWSLPHRAAKERQLLMQKLESLNSAEFDIAYAKVIEEDHDQLIELLTRATHTQGISTDLQTFAERALPTCKAHERMTDDLRHREVEASPSSDASGQ